MKQIPDCAWRETLVTFGTGVPTAATFSGRPFYVDVTTNRGYVLNGSAVVPLGVATEPEPPFVPDFAGINAVQVTNGFSQPWAVVHLPNGDFLVTEKSTSKIRRLRAGVKTDLAGVPASVVGGSDGHGGMMDLILDSQFASNRTIYFTYVVGSVGTNQMRVAKATVNADVTGITGVTALLTVTPAKSGNTSQFGGRLAEHPDGGRQIPINNI